MLGSYDTIVKTEEIRRKIQERDFDAAQKVIDTMSLKKVKNIADLSLFADVLAHNDRYDEAMELLNRVYKKSKTRRTLYQMVYVSIGRKDIEVAERYLSEYQEVAPNDYNIYMFRYKIDKLKKEPFEVLIKSLENLKKKAYIEKWAYELAKLYYKAGMEKECIKECSDIILWFGEGSYVERAKVLKAYYSGELDKDEIIQGLKNRAATLEQSSQESAPSLHKDNEVTEDTLPNIMVNDSVEEEITDTVSKEIENILLRDQDNSTDIADINLKEVLDYKNVKNKDLEKLTKLSEELDLDIMQIFGNFLHVKSIQNQLVKSLELITSKHTKSVQMIITGAPSSGKTTLAKDIALFLNKTGKLQTSRIAKISALKLNQIQAIKNKEALRNCCVVIEDASELKKPTIDKILALIKDFHGEIAVIFEENKKNMNRLFRECPKLMELFKNRIHLPQYSEKELRGFAYSYIMLRDYKLNEVAFEALNEGLDEIINNVNKEKQLESISKYVQDALNSSDIRTGTQLSKLASSGRIIDSDILSLLPEDFNIQIKP
ncbi:MAG: hypothetical protein GX321_05675 [Clostridiales bacterium]|nr:hypothetical protein [Clostridiales bacterium]